MNGSIEQIEQVLLTELAPLDEQAARVQTDLDAIDDKRNRLNAAIEALGSGRKKAKSTRRTKPCATKAEVVQIVMDLLKDNGSLSMEDLDGLAKDRLSRDLGKSLSGFGLRFREALADPRFIVDADGDCVLAPMNALASTRK